jgi:hypothetical protein
VERCDFEGAAQAVRELRRLGIEVTYRRHNGEEVGHAV